MGIQTDFLEAVLPESGVFCITRIRAGSGPRQDKYQSIAAMCDALDIADTKKEDYYFAVSSFKDMEARQFRAQTNALYTRCLLLDVDVKDKEGYCKTQAEALPLIDTLCAAINFPKPIIVNSGYGYHVYWPLAEAIPSADWKALAKRFHAAVSMFAPPLVADSSRVSDSSGILRIPGTFNNKNDTHVEVTLEQWHSDWLTLEVANAGLGVGPAKAAKRKAVTLETQYAYEPTPLDKTIKNCNWVQDYLRNAKDAEEPAWYAMLGMAAYVTHTKKDGTTINGANIAHIFSKDHPDYTHDGTEIKFHQAKTKQTGPTTCAKLQSINPEPCKGCPFVGAVKTPLNAARLQRPATGETVLENVLVQEISAQGVIAEQIETVKIPVPPKPYFRGESGGVYTRIVGEEDGDDKIICVYPNDLYPVKRFRAETEEEEKVECHLWLPQDGLRKFRMPLGMVADPKALATFLASRGVMAVDQSSPKRVAKYFTDCVSYMQSKEKAEVEYTRYGWRDQDTDRAAFVVGNGFYDSKGEFHSASFPSYLKDAAPAAASFGSLEEWTKGFNVYKSIPNSEAYQFTIMLGFAAPLLALTEYSGVMYNMVGDSGAGKSTAMKIMTSVWGKPNENHVRVNDNLIPVNNFIGYLNSIPVAFDEITTMSPAAATEFTLNFTSGRGKMRADRDGNNKANHTSWDTIVVCTSNTSMYSKFSQERNGYNAEAMRLFEVVVPPPLPPEDATQIGNVRKITAAMALIQKNYGVAGRAYIPYVLKNRDRIRKILADKTQKILQESGATSAERFWAVLLACMHVGTTISNGLRLHGYSADTLLRWAYNQVEEARTAVSSTFVPAESVVADFFNNTLHSTLRTRNGRVELGGMGGNLREVTARIEYEDGKPCYAYVSARALKDYCSNHNVDYSWLRTKLHDGGFADVNVVKRLTAGTDLVSGTTKCIRVDLERIGVAL